MELVNIFSIADEISDYDPSQRYNIMYKFFHEFEEGKHSLTYELIKAAEKVRRSQLPRRGIDPDKINGYLWHDPKPTHKLTTEFFEQMWQKGIRVMDDVTICRGVWFDNRIGEDVITAIAFRSFIDAWARIGSGTIIQCFAKIGAAAQIGPQCNIGKHCDLEDWDFKSEYPVVLGAQAVLKSYVFVGNNTTIGNQSIVHMYSSIEQDCRIAENVTIHKHVDIGSGVLIGMNSKIGANTSIDNNVTIGDDMTIGRNVIIEHGAVIKNGINIPNRYIVTADTVISSQNDIIC